MIGLSSFLKSAIHMGAIQPPMGVKYDKINELKIQPVSQNNETNIMMSDREFAFEERAAILEYDGGYSRRQAERLARAEIYGDNA